MYIHTCPNCYRTKQSETIKLYHCRFCREWYQKNILMRRTILDNALQVGGVFFQVPERFIN